MILNNTIANVNPAQHPDYEADIIAIMRSGLTPAVMRKRLLAHHENHIASALSLLTNEERMRLYNILEPRDLAGILEYCEHAGQYISELSMGRQALLLSHITASTAANILRQMEKAERNTLLELLCPETRQQISLINSFDEDLIGSHMSTNYISIRTDLDVCRA
ncbi:MAG: magnesium transporter, partial [Clostridia bacterium]|nr:magnesium transporter [Clostridia bacterium]